MVGGLIGQHDRTPIPVGAIGLAAVHRVGIEDDEASGGHLGQPLPGLVIALVSNFRVALPCVVGAQPRLAA